MTKPLLTDEQCDEFRRLPVSFNDMVRAIHQAGHAAGRAEAETLLRDALPHLHLCSDLSLADRVGAFLKGDTQQAQPNTDPQSSPPSA